MVFPFLPFILFWLLLGFGLFRGRVRRKEVTAFASLWLGLFLMSIILNNYYALYFVPMVLVDIFLAVKVFGAP